MTRLPLDYPGIYSAWQTMAGALYHPDSPYSARIMDETWKKKLSLMGNIASHSPDAAECLCCGECCLDFPFACHAVEFLHLLPYMAMSWPRDWQKHFFENKLGILTPDGKNLCPFLERGKCSIYPVRPLICRRSVCGDHICNRLSIDFDSLGHWCNHEQVSRQLTLMNILYFDCDQNPPVEMGWTVKTGRADGSQNRIVTAPFEIWLLVLFDDCSWNRLLDTPGYRPLIKFADKSLKG